MLEKFIKCCFFVVVISVTYKTRINKKFNMNENSSELEI